MSAGSDPRVERQTVRTVRVELPGGRVVRAARYPDEPGEVAIRTSAPEAPPGCRSEDSLSLPVDALPALREALAVLHREEP